MKRMYVLLFFLSVGLAAQESEASKKKYIKEGNQVRYVEYHDNGEVAQTGYFKNGKLHGKWTSYDALGKKIMMGNYSKGKKTSKWLFWKGDVLMEVDYNDNKILRTVQWNNATLIAKK